MVQEIPINEIINDKEFKETLEFNDTVSENVNENTILNSSLISNIVKVVGLGTLIVTGTVILYNKMGEKGILTYLNGNYAVIGISEKNNQYYFKIIDKKTNKIYYIKITKKMIFKTNYQKLLRIKGNVFMYEEINSNIPIKLADYNTLYFIKNKILENENNYYIVMDSFDMKTYYIPFSNLVEEITIDSILNQKKD